MITELMTQLTDAAGQRFVRSVLIAPDLGQQSLSRHDGSGFPRKTQQNLHGHRRYVVHTARPARRALQRVNRKLTQSKALLEVPWHLYTFFHVPTVPAILLHRIGF